MPWLTYAFVSALAAAATALLAKRGVEGVPSNLATALSWLAYFRALQLGPASRVAPVDKLSLPLTVLCAALLLGETVTWKVWAGVLLMTTGALLTIA